METLVIFTNPHSIDIYLEQLVVNWELSYVKFDELIVDDKKFIFIYDNFENKGKDENDEEVKIKNEKYKLLITNLIDSISENESVYILHHTMPTSEIINLLVENLKSKVNSLTLSPTTPITHLHQKTYQKIRPIHENLDNNEKLKEIFEEIKKFFEGDIDLESKLDFLHNLLIVDTINENHPLIGKHNLNKDIKKLKNNKKGCFDQNYMKILTKIRDIILD